MLHVTLTICARIGKTSQKYILQHSTAKLAWCLCCCLLVDGMDILAEVVFAVTEEFQRLQILPCSDCRVHDGDIAPDEQGVVLQVLRILQCFNLHEISDAAAIIFS